MTELVKGATDRNGRNTMDLFEKENSFAAADQLSDYFLDGMFSLSDLPIVTDIRGYGLLAGFDLAPGNAPGVRGLEVQKALFHAGLNLKMTGDSGLLAPPFISEKSHIDKIVERLRGVLGAI